LEDLLIQLFCLSLLLIPVGFLTIKSWVTTLSLMAFLLSLMLLFSTRDYRRSEGTPRQSNRDRLLPLLFAAPMIIDLLAQIARQDWAPSQLDAPARLLVFIPIYILLRRLNIDLSRSFTTCVALASPLALTHLAIDTNHYWGDRWASSPADPNTLGLFCVALVSIPLAKLATEALSKQMAGLYTLSIACGAVIIMGSQSRIALLGLLSLLCMGIIIGVCQRGMRRLLPALASVLVIGVGLIWSVPAYQLRFTSIYTELIQWTQIENQSTSAATRLDMLEVSVLLLSKQPLFGYGDGNYQNVARQLPSYPQLHHAVESIHNTPHNEILTKGLRSGIAGAGASALLLLLPIAVFVRRARHKQSSGVSVAIAGGMFSLGILTASFSMAVFSLAFTTSFFAVVMAILLAATNNDGSVARLATQ
jgi:O-antigen ligase